MLHSIYFIIASMAIGFITYKILYWIAEHASVKFGFGVINDVELLKILAVVGLFLSFID